MAGTFATIEIAGYGFSLPQAWRIARPSGEGPFGEVHAEPEAEVAIDLQVLRGMAAPETRGEILAMYARAGGSKPLPLTMGPPGAESVGMAIEMAPPGRGARLNRELYACALGGDLLTAALTWRRETASLPHLRRVLELILGGARPVAA